jgi:hypothetical protein
MVTKCCVSLSSAGLANTRIIDVEEFQQRFTEQYVIVITERIQKSETMSYQEADVPQTVDKYCPEILKN